MASGMARGAAARGKRIAFGDGKRIIWGPHSAEVFWANPNIAKPGEQHDRDIEWIAYYKGHRIYNRLEGNRWVWNYEYKATPGEVFLGEIVYPKNNMVVIEPNVPRNKSVAPNKQWPIDRYQEVADLLLGNELRVVQPFYAGAMHRLRGINLIATNTFRDALKLLKQASLYIGPEGGLHHGAAAVGIPAVVLFGGFIPPQVTGYDFHENLTGDFAACGSILACKHCIAAMDAIKVHNVTDAAQRLLQ